MYLCWRSDFHGIVILCSKYLFCPYIFIAMSSLSIHSSELHLSIIGILNKQRRQRERHQTKSLTNKTVAVHVRYKSLQISSPSHAKQEREMTKFCVVWGTRTTTTTKFSYFHWNLRLSLHIQPEHDFKAIGVLNRSGQLRFSLVKY